VVFWPWQNTPASDTPAALRAPLKVTAGWKEEIDNLNVKIGGKLRRPVATNR
jgi:hypothetical protein